MLVLTLVITNSPLPVSAGGPLPAEDSQLDLGVDVLTGVPIVPASAATPKTPHTWAGPNAPEALLLDNFNRANGPLGISWTLRSPITTSFNVVTNTARGGADAISTYNLPTGASGAEVDVIATSANVQYVGLVLDYNTTTNNKILIKVQGQDDVADFDILGCYSGVNSQDAFGPGVIALSTPIVTARMQVSIDITRNVIINFSNVNGGAGTQTYMCSGAPATGGNQIGIASYITSDGALDNFSVLNVAPVANDDSYNLTEDTTLVITASGVLSNDTDMELSPLSAAVLSPTSNGLLTLTANGAFTYTPQANFFGTDIFTYTASDGALTDTARVTLTVTAASDPPVANDDTYNTLEDTPLNVTAPGVLGNDVDPDGTTLTVTLLSGVNNGTLNLRSDGTFNYTPTQNYNGSDSFTYMVFDGTLTDPAVVTITVTAVNDIPVAVNDAYTVTEDAVLTVTVPGVLGNDTDVEGNTLFTTGASGISHGTLTLRSNGSFVYTATENYTGLDVFTYRVWDLDITKFTVGVVTITVTPLNDPPLAVNDVYTIAEDTLLNISAPGVLSNDVEYDGTPISATLQTSVTHGSLVLNPNGGFAYFPFNNYNGPDAFTYSITDGVFTATATVTINVTAVNDAPTAVANVYTTTEDTALVIAAPGVLGNDSDAELSPLTATVQTGPSQGSVVLLSNGAFTYTPAVNFFGTAVFTYAVSDGSLTSTAPVTINVTGTPDAPIANNDAYTTTEETPLSVSAPGVLGNDSEPDGEPFTATLVSGVSSGSLIFNPNGSFTFTPALDFFGIMGFTYRISDGVFSSTAVVSITVVPVNDPPLANDDAYTITRNIPLVVPLPGVLANDVEPDLQPLTPTLVSGVSNGTLTFNVDGSFFYTPNANYVGSDSFSYRVSDSTSLTDTALVLITVTSFNNAPTANDDAYSTAEDTPLNVPYFGVLTNDTDPERNTLRATVVSGPAHGALSLHLNGSFFYSPTLNYFGSDSFVYQVTDGVFTDSATVNLTITPVGGDAPLANDDVYTGTINVPLVVPAPGVMTNDVEPDLEPLTATLVSGVGSGTLTFRPDGGFFYTATGGFTGQVTFVYSITDGTAADSAQVTINIIAANGAPVANDNTYSTTEDTPLIVAVPGVLGNDTDPQGNVLRATVVTGPAHGALSLNLNGSFTYTPAANYFGTDTFVYQASDGALSDTAVVTITITPVGGDAPLANDDVYTGTLNIPLVVPAPGVMTNDVEPDQETLTAALVSGVGSGTLTFRPDGGFWYTATGGFTGQVTFVYSITDGTATDSAQVTINIVAANSAPVANDNTYSTTEDIPLIVPVPGVLGNDTDPEGNALQATLVTSPTNGVVSLSPNGSFTYTPAANYFGTDTFVYRASDSVLSDTAIVTITVVASSINDAPLANDDVYTATKNTTLNVLAPGVLGNDVEPDLTALTAVLQSGVANGTLNLLSNGSFGYTPSLNFTGTVSFVYAASDGSLTDTATVVINVVESAAPVANDDVFVTSEDTTLVVTATGVLSNDVNALTTTVQTGPANGLLALDVNGGFVYTPNLNFVGLDVFTYTARNGLLTDTAVVTITVTAVNDEPAVLPVGTQTVTVNSLGYISIVITDVDSLPSGITIVVTSSVQSVLPDSNIAISGTGYTRTLSVMPVLTGTTTVYITLTDNMGITRTYTFTLVVVPQRRYIPFVWKPQP